MQRGPLRTFRAVTTVVPRIGQETTNLAKTNYTKTGLGTIRFGEMDDPMIGREANEGGMAVDAAHALDRDVQTVRAMVAISRRQTRPRAIRFRNGAV